MYRAPTSLEPGVINLAGVADGRAVGGIDGWSDVDELGIFLELRDLRGGVGAMGKLGRLLGAGGRIGGEPGAEFFELEGGDGADLLGSAGVGRQLDEIEEDNVVDHARDFAGV